MDETNVNTDDSLLAPRRMGGLEGGRGHAFQSAYVLSKIPEWLKDKAMHSIVQEGWSDIEVMYEDQTRLMIQVKNTQLGLPELREVLEDFHQREESSAGALYKEYVVACSGAVRSVSSLKRVLDRLHATTAYADDERASSMRSLAKLSEKLRLDRFLPLLRTKARIELGLGWLASVEWVQRLLIAYLVSSLDFPTSKATEACSEIQTLVARQRGTALEVSSIRKILERRKAEAISAGASPFLLITHDFIDQFVDARPHSHFYQGAIPTWADLAANRDVHRELEKQIVEQIVEHGTSRMLVPVVAGGGEGKSTFLMRLAVDLGVQGHQVLFLKADAQEISSGDLEKALVPSDPVAFVLIDNASRVENLVQFLQAVSQLPMGTHLRIVLACKTYEWSSMSQICRSGFDAILAADSQPYSLSVLSRNEIAELLDKLSSAGEINVVAPEDVDTVIDFCIRTTRGKMLPLVIQLTHGKEIEGVIKEELQRVHESGADLFCAYRFICLCVTLHSGVTKNLLRKLTERDDIVLDLHVTLPGLVEKVGSRIRPRHETIGELVTEELYAGLEDVLGDDICHLLGLIVDGQEVEVLADMIRWSFPIPSSQLLRVLNGILDAAYALGRPDLVLLALQILMGDFDNKDLALELLAARTPWILEEFVFGFCDQQAKIDFEKIGLVLDLPFIWPTVQKVISPEAFANCDDEGFDNALKWAELFEISSVTAPFNAKYRDFLAAVVGLIYQVLAQIVESRKSEALLRYADFLRNDFEHKIARKFYEEILEDDENSARAHLGVSVCAFLDHKNELALAHYKKAAELDRETIYADWHLSSLEELLAGMDEYEELLELVKGRARQTHQMRQAMKEDLRKLAPILRLKKTRTKKERRMQDFPSIPDESGALDLDVFCSDCDLMKDCLSSMPREARIHFFGESGSLWPYYGKFVQES